MASIEQNNPIPAETSRGGVSPIGTTSPNTGSSANTNSSYGQGAFASGISEPSVASYTVQNTDYQGIIIFNTASAIAVTLNSAVKPNFSCTILNLSSGVITLTPTAGTVNGSASLTLAAMQGVQVFFANRAWLAYAGSTVVQVVPQSIAAVAGEFLTSYNAATGIFTLSTPAGISATITTAKLTVGGTNGSMVFQNGILTAQVQAT